MSNANRIDVHHHFLPPEFLAYLKRTGTPWTGGPAVPEWNVDLALETMDRYQIASAVASVVPHTYFGDTAAAIHWARHCNDFSARIVQEMPDRFGAFATLPLPDADGACREIEHSLDVLKLDGVVLYSSYGVQYPGDPQFDSVFAELDKRKAIVFIHPNTIVPGSIVPKLTLPWAVVEFVMDTTRCITNLLYSGTFERYPNIRYVVAHAGGTFPWIAWRIAMAGQMLHDWQVTMPKGPMHYLQKLYVDTALSVSDQVMAGLDKLLPQSHVLFGSDWPMAGTPALHAEHAYLSSTSALDETRRRAIDRGNALALFPRFGASTERVALRA
ncbi:MAG TPA: amidohydrolase family protein [Gammaproteobacteria bacterium]|nr:amidohydrolase family protein [Gammaproteobacteria bacterium]